MTNTSTNELNELTKVEVSDFKEMPKNILQLLQEHKYYEAFNLAPIYLKKMLDEKTTEFPSKSNLAEMIKLYIKLLSLSRLSNKSCKLIDANTTVKLIESAHRHGLVDDKIMFNLHSKDGEVKAFIAKWGITANVNS